MQMAEKSTLWEVSHVKESWWAKAENVEVRNDEFEHRLRPKLHKYCMGKLQWAPVHISYEAYTRSYSLKVLIICRIRIIIWLPLSAAAPITRTTRCA